MTFEKNNVFSAFVKKTSSRMVSAFYNVSPTPPPNSRDAGADSLTPQMRVHLSPRY